MTTSPNKKRALGRKETRRVLAESHAQMGATSAESNVAYYQGGAYLTTPWYPENTCPTTLGAYQGLVSSVVSISGKTKIVYDSAGYNVVRMFWWTGAEWLSGDAPDGKKYKHPLTWRGLLSKAECAKTKFS